MTYAVPAGYHIRAAIENAINIALEHDAEVTFKFNDRVVIVTAASDVDKVIEGWEAEGRRRRDAWKNSEDGKEHARQHAVWEAARRAREVRNKAMPKPTWKDAAAYEAEVVRQTTPAPGDSAFGAAYARGIIAYAEAWASVMEERMAAGATVADCADKASHDADYDGITGFMYGCAVGLLAQHWIHGEELRRWHNLKTQIGNEGEKANESGGVLNPALLTIGGGAS